MKHPWWWWPSAVLGCVLLVGIAIADHVEATRRRKATTR